MVDAVATNEATKTASRLAARCAAVASLGAAVIHFAVAPMHWRDWLPSGVFFASIAVFQLIWAFVAWSRPGSLVLAAGVLANAGSALLWVMSRTVGAPFGPYAGQPEAVEAAGICVLLLQCYVVMGAGWAWSRKYQTGEVSGFGRALVLMGANTVMAGAVAVGLAASLQGHHHDHHGGSTEAQGERHAGHEAHMDGNAHMEVHQHPSESLPQPMNGVTQPSDAPTPAEPGLPVTDMGLDIDGDHYDSESPAPPDASVTQPSLNATQPSAAPTPAESDLPVTDSALESDGHYHEHDD